MGRTLRRSSCILLRKSRRSGSRNGTNPLKRWKLSYEDFRNRNSWKEYTEAIEDMMEKTSTNHAPWYLVAENHKNYSRLAVFNILIDRLGQGVDCRRSLSIRGSPKPQPSFSRRRVDTYRRK